MDLLEDDLGFLLSDDTRSESTLKIEDEDDKVDCYADNDASENGSQITDTTQIDIRRKYAKRTSEAGKPSQFSDYNKKEMFKSLNANGWTQENFENTIQRFHINKTDAIKYYNEHIQLAEMYVHQECECWSFTTLTEFLKICRDCGLADKTQIEQGAVVNLIGYCEKFPNPDKLDGIDMTSIYNFLSSALLGHPQPGLNEESAALVCEIFETLIDDSNSVEGDKAVRRMFKILHKPLVDDYGGGIAKRNLKLDPLCLDANNRFSCPDNKDTIIKEDL